MTESNPPITTQKYCCEPNPGYGSKPPNNLNSPNPVNLNYYTTSDWGVRLIQISSNQDPTKPIITHIRVVWSEFGTTSENTNFTLTCNRYIAKTDPSTDITQTQKPTINNIIFKSSDYKVNGSQWAGGNVAKDIIDNFNFVTYYCDIDIKVDDDTVDYIYIYTITGNSKTFSSYFIRPSTVTPTLTALVGDNGVSFGNSQGYGSTYNGYGSAEPDGYTLAMKNFFFQNYLDDDIKYCASKYEPTATFIYLKDNKTYNFSKTYDGNKYLLSLMCHMGDILYIWEYIDFWKNYFQMFECINSIVPIFYTPGNHEYFDGGAQAYSFHYFNCLLPFNIPIDITKTDNNIDDSINQTITNNLRTKILTWKYKTWNPLCIISYVNSHDNIITYPGGNPFSFQSSEPFLDNEKVDNTIYFWHVDSNVFTIINSKQTFTLPDNSVLFYGHKHKTDLITQNEKTCVFVTGGFGNNQGGENNGWCELIQTDTNTIKIKVINTTGILPTDFTGNPMPASYPFILDTFNEYFKTVSYYFTFTKIKPPPNPSKTKCCPPVIWNYKKECNQIKTINSLKNNNTPKINYWKFIKNKSKC